MCAAHVLADLGEFEGHRPLAVVGRDTRISGQFLEAAVVAGLASAGVDVLLLGVLPTPGVAYMTERLGADLGVMLSASHNPMPDNGIKFLARGGHKLDDAIEIAIERRMGEPWERPTGGGVGRVSVYGSAVEEYAAHLESTITHPLVGLKVVLDCAEGAAHAAGPRALEDAGATVIAIHADPDGLNINDNCGSTHLGSLHAAVVEHGAHAGFALDGDADRCLAVDADGNIVDGDQLLAILSLSLRDQGRLAKDTVVATVMSNLGFVQAMRANDVGVRQTKVGDRYVLEAMKVSGYSLGGEQSGHVILSDHATTGDGILTTLHVMERMATTGKSLAELASVMTRLPQVLLNVPDVDKTRADEDAVLAAAVAEEEAVLGDRGRILLRPSGTEPIVRVMVEAPTQDEAQGVASRLADVVKASCAPLRAPPDIRVTARGTPGYGRRRGRGHRADQPPQRGRPARVVGGRARRDRRPARQAVAAVGAEPRRAARRQPRARHHAAGRDRRPRDGRRGLLTRRSRRTSTPRWPTHTPARTAREGIGRALVGELEVIASGDGRTTMQSEAYLPPGGTGAPRRSRPRWATTSPAASRSRS